jgi:hypothetical protein
MGSFLSKVKLFAVLAVIGISSGRAQDWLYPIPAAVSYVSSGTVYLNAGTGAGLRSGDTIIVVHRPGRRLTIVLNAVSSSSASALFRGKFGDIAVGDSAYTSRPLVLKEMQRGQSGIARTDTTKSAASRPAPAFSPARFGTTANASHIRGRIAVQYMGAGELKGTMTFSQPAVLLRLEIPQLFGTNYSFSFYGRSYYDFSPQFAVYGTGSRMKYRLYEMTLSSGGKGWFGFDAGRLTSRYAGGLGQIDGAQVYVRQGNFTGGVLVGTQPDYTNSGIDVTQPRGIFFMNYGWGDVFLNRTELTLAYGQQLHEGRFDRDFLFVQGSSHISSALMLYESTEIDLHTVENGVKKGAFNLTNSFITVSYLPSDWLTVTGGYDATRPIYLFDSMKSLADSLINRELQQGFRSSISFRLPLHVVAGLDGTYRLRTSTSREAKTVSGSLRSYSIFGTPLSMGVRYSRIFGTYTDGRNISIDADLWLTGSLSLNTRFEQYTYDLVGSLQGYKTSTLSGMVNWSMTRKLYTMVSFDQVWDSIQNNQRIFFELGLRF